jgi:hypothetical protein
MPRYAFLTALAAFALSGCYTVAKTAVDVATLPVKAVAKGVDFATTSQSEADEKRGRDMRKAEEDYGKRLRAWENECARAQRSGIACPPRPEFVPPEPRG